MAELADFSKASALGFAQGQEMAGENPLGTFIRNMLSTYQQKKSMEQEYAMKVGLVKEEAKARAENPSPIEALIAGQLSGKGSGNIPETPEEAKSIFLKNQEDVKPEELIAEPIYSTMKGQKVISGYEAKITPEAQAERRKRATLKQEAMIFSGEMEGMVDSIWNSADKLIPAPKTPKEAERLGMRRKLGSASIGGVRPQRAVGLGNENAIAFKDVIEAEATPTIRALGEKGMLTNQDIQRALKLLPHDSDSQYLREQKKIQLKDFLQSKLKVYSKKSDSIPTSESSVSYYIKKYPDRSREEIISAMQKKGLM